ncbi:uncharacterized protein LOC117335349 isoform X1 [Pecten maximus]|uniref:uncharacterized protein LOC117335349 isoform X1 n=2 Tax=Pecten maximus TaxID=6579 RepID=UPI00145916C3|nr:uncharacterized protein LOC117335349 isoform X1 [Pecten maximus]
MVLISSGNLSFLAFYVLQIMEDTRLKEIAKHLVTDVIQKATEYVRTERKEMAEMTGQLDKGVDDIVQLTIGQSITAIRSGQTSPTDRKMAEMSGQLDKDVDDIVGRTIGRSITAIRSGQTSPTDQKMAEISGQLDKDLDNIVDVTIGRSIAAIREGEMSPTDHKLVYSEILEKTRQSGTGNDAGLQTAKTYPADRDHKTEVPSIVTRNKAADKVKKTFFERHLDRLLGREKKTEKKMKTAELCDSTPSGGSRKRPSKAHNKKDWILKNILCCFVRQTATVEPIDD